MSNILITPKTGTTWVNLCVDSEDLSNPGYANTTYTISEIVSAIGGVNCQGVIGSNSTSTKSITESLGNNLLDANQLFVSCYVAAGDADFFYLKTTALNGSAQAVGGTQWFDLSGGTVETFTASAGGTLAEAGIESVTGGYRVWAVINCGGNDTFGSSVLIGFSDADANLDLTGDGSTINGYAGGWSWVDAPTGDIGYIAS